MKDGVLWLDIYDLFLVVGAVVMAYGLWLAWRPLAFIFIGGALVGTALLRKSTAAPARKRGR